MENKQPQWQRGDSLRSIRDLAKHAFQAVATLPFRQFEKGYNKSLVDIGDLPPVRMSFIEHPVEREELLDD